MTTNVLILIVAVAVALAAGFLIRSRSGKVLDGSAVDPDSALLLDAGLSTTCPTILHFSAPWCGPCAAVRRVVDQVIGKLAAEGVTVLDLEVDIDENPSLAQQLKVLSLPTTFIYDASGAQLHRIPGVPKADALLAALRPAS